MTRAVRAENRRSPLVLAMENALRLRIGEEGVSINYAKKETPGRDFFIVKLSELDTNGKPKELRFSVPTRASDFHGKWRAGEKVRPMKFTAINGRATPSSFEWQRPSIVLLAFGTIVSVLLQVINLLR